MSGHILAQARAPLALILGVLASVPGSAAAQDAAAAPEAAGARGPAAGLAEPRPLTPADYGRFESLGAIALSPDGRWVAYGIARVDGENELRVADAAGEVVHTAAFGTRATFSRDGRWLAYAIGRSEEERERLQRANEPVRDGLGLLELGTGEATTIESVASFAFSADGRHLAFRRYPADREGTRADVVVRELATGRDLVPGGVESFAWSDAAPLLALLVATEDGIGNGVHLYDAAAGALRVLDARRARYAGLAWRRDADDLAVLRGEAQEAFADTAYAVLAWRGLAGARPAARTHGPALAAGDGEVRRIVAARAPAWSDDGRIVYVGVRPRERAEGGGEDAAEVAEAGGEAGESRPGAAGAGAAGGRSLPGDAADRRADRAGLEIWHARDFRIVPGQRLTESRDRDRSDLAAWHVDADRLVRLGDGDPEDVQLSGGNRVATVLDRAPYERDLMFGRGGRDLYQVDVETGERRRVAADVRFQYGASPEGRYLLYVQGDDFRTFDTRTGRRANLTAGLPTSFTNRESDYPVDRLPPYGVAGWTRGDASVIFYDRYDLWEVRPDGSRPRRLTRGAEDEVRHRYLRLDPDERAIDPRRPLYLSLYGEWTKMHGFARLRPGRDAERLVWEERGVGRLARARDAEVFAFVEQAYDVPPAIRLGGPDLAGARPVARTNPFRSEFLWGRAELIEYTGPGDRRLQGVLIGPSGFDPGRRYPMVVYIYERLSQNLHRYVAPDERNAYNATVFSSRDYFVLLPDITYLPRDPGVSALASLRAAVAAAADRAPIDTDRVGVIGHSWGGYQSAFLATTDLFAAAVAGAALTNLISMYGMVFFVAGDSETGHFEVGQERMEVPLWQDPAAYIRNSPVFRADSLDTPLLLMFGNADRNVSWTQGIELYNAARRLDKQLVFLVYDGEDHGLRRRPNQIDYHRRVLEWFDHYLKGEPAPRWITEGVPLLEQSDEIDRLAEPPPVDAPVS